MTWTTQTPTVDGWYWWRESKESKPEIHKVIDRFVPVGNCVCYFASSMGGEWYGPLVPPVDEPVDTRILPRGGSSTAPPKCDAIRVACEICGGGGWINGGYKPRKCSVCCGKGSIPVKE